MNRALSEYIKNAKVKGFTEAQIRRALLTSGWDKEEVEAAFISPPETPAPTVVPGSRKRLINEWWTENKSTIYIGKWVLSGFALLGVTFISSTLINAYHIVNDPFFQTQEYELLRAVFSTTRS